MTRVRMTRSASPSSPAERRLKAMQELAADGVFDADPSGALPGQVRRCRAGRALALAENVVRIAMHPADQVVAFTKLSDAGQSVSAIAARFGASERIVEQRLRLGNAAPELLDRLPRRRDRPRSAEGLRRHPPTRERQIAVWEQVSAQP